RRCRTKKFHSDGGSDDGHRTKAALFKLWRRENRSRVSANPFYGERPHAALPRMRLRSIQARPGTARSEASREKCRCSTIGGPHTAETASDGNSIAETSIGRQ